MPKLLKILLRIHLARLGKDFYYPHALIPALIGGSCYFLLHLISFAFVLTKFTFPDWTPFQLWTVFFTFEIFTYAAFYFLYTGMYRTVEDISTGHFDFFLTKPVSSRFLSFFRAGSAHNLLLFLLGFFLILPSLTPALPLYLLTLISSLWVFHSLSVILISLNFKFGPIRQTIGLPFEFQETLKYPSTLYHRLHPLFRVILLPLSLLTTLPATVLLLYPLSSGYFVIYFLTLIAISVISHLAWHSGLRHYSSASS